MLDEQAAIDRTQAFCRAMVAGDAEALDELLAPDFTYTHMSSRVEPKDELLPSVRGGRRNRRMDLEDVRVRMYPGVAIVSGLNHMDVGPEDRPLIFDSRCVAMLVPLEDAWKLVVYQSARVPEDGAA
ncbi:MAG: nuclear transport factor 2 family protein [Dehalococcoidia bacterium]